MTRMISVTALSALSVCMTLVSAPARAALELNISPSATVAGNNGVFDVYLSDTDSSGSTPYDVGAFSFEVSVPTMSGIAFTGADGSSPFYIFGTEQDGAFTSTIFPATDVIGSDSDFTPPYYTAISPGSAYSLGEVEYTVSAGTPLGALIPVTFVNIGSGTSLSDANTNPIPFTANNGAIIAANPVVSATPEPSQIGMLALMGLGLGGLLLRARRRCPAA